MINRIIGKTFRVIKRETRNQNIKKGDEKKLWENK